MGQRELIEQAIEEGAALPAGPAVIARMEEICRDPQATARDLGKVLQLDSSLTTRILKRVNSSFYGLSSTIKTVTHAVVILGFQEVRNIALSVPVANFFHEAAGTPGIDIEALWNQSVANACLARTLSYHIGHPVPEQVFVSGILCKIGMVVLNNVLQEKYAIVVDACGEPSGLPQAETEAFGITHVEVGTRLARKWKFPDDLCRAIEYQYEPVHDNTIETEAGLIYAARRIFATIQNEQDMELALATFPDKLTEEFALTPDATQEAVQKAAAEFETAKQMLND